jgi:UTP--glucose-1-phosphate uridylyltransferase
MSTDPDPGRIDDRNRSAPARRAACAVIPAAGFATRFLPVTKAVPKELLPVVDRPVLHYIVEEAAAADLTDVLLVTGRGKTSMVDYFDRRPDLEEVLAAKGNQDRLAAVVAASQLAEVHAVRQHAMLGLGHAVGCAAAHVGDAPFAVLLGDEFVDPTTPLLPQMIDLQQRAGGIVVALLEVSEQEISRYGIAEVTAADPALGEPDTTVAITGMVEKPPLSEAPSNLAVIGRYVLPGGIFDAIRRTGPGAGDEIQLTDAMALMLAEGTPVHGVIFRGVRYDTGTPLGYLQAVVQLASQHEQVGPEFRQWLAAHVGESTATVPAGGRTG